MHQVEKAPHDNGVIVHPHNKGGHRTGNPHPSQQGVDQVPGAHAAFAEMLSCCKLQIQQWHAFHEQHDEVGNKESTWKMY